MARATKKPYPPLAQPFLKTMVTQTPAHAGFSETEAFRLARQRRRAGREFKMGKTSSPTLPHTLPHVRKLFFINWLLLYLGSKGKGIDAVAAAEKDGFGRSFGKCGHPLWPGKGFRRFLPLTPQ